jgi:hypothetical protein
VLLLLLRKRSVQIQGVPERGVLADLRVVGLTERGVVAADATVADVVAERTHPAP